MDSEIRNRLLIIAARGQSFEEANLDEKHRTEFDKILKEIKNAPEGVMLSPLNEWAGDEYDEIIDMIERVQARIEKEERPEQI